MCDRRGTSTGGQRLALAAWAGLIFAGGAGLAAQEPDYEQAYDAARAQTGIDGRYGYVRVIDGSGTLIQAGTVERVRLQSNEPILVGDELFLSGRSRAELLLADDNLVRVGDEAELTFRALGNSSDSEDPATLLVLRRGTLQLVVPQGGPAGADHPVVQAPEAEVRVREPGSYLVTLERGGRTEVVVRDGRAEVITGSDAVDLRSGEAAIADARTGRIRFAAAPGLDRLERWGHDLATGGRGEYRRYVDDDLHYAASSLDGHGAWVYVSGRPAWRPYVRAGWLPYRHGRWRYTPSGLIWVSYEPWGWVPYHYGYWDHVSAYGWVWFPGRRFATAHVYWYWGPHYAGWVPVGYYWRHYGHRYGKRFGFHFGVYGTIGGGFGRFRNWCFLPLSRFGHHRQHRWVVHGYDLGRRGQRLGRGILTTDTRHLTPELWRRPSDALQRLRRISGVDRGRSLPDAGPFVERRPRLPGDLERVTLRDGDAFRAGGPGRITRGPDRRGEVARAPIGVRRGRTAGADGGAAERPRIRTPVERGARQRAGTRAGGRTVPERPAVQAPTRRGAAGPEARSARPELRRPAARPESRPEARRPTARPQARRPTARPQARRPTARPQARRPTARPQPRRPTARPQARRPAARPQARRPSVSRRPSVGARRPSVRRTVRPSTRSTRFRPSAPRPTLRRSPSRPAPRIRSGTSRARPAPRARPSRGRPSVRTRPSVSRRRGGSGRRGGGSGG